MNFYLQIGIISVVICFIIFCVWFIGGIHLDEVKVLGFEKAKEICGEDNLIIYQGYERSIFEGFGGRAWYQCKIDNVWYQFGVSRRINKSEAQVYNFEQMTIFPNNFNIQK